MQQQETAINSFDDGPRRGTADSQPSLDAAPIVTPIDVPSDTEDYLQLFTPGKHISRPPISGVFDIPTPSPAVSRSAVSSGSSSTTTTPPATPPLRRPNAAWAPGGRSFADTIKQSTKVPRLVNGLRTRKLARTEFWAGAPEGLANYTGRLEGFTPVARGQYSQVYTAVLQSSSQPEVVSEW